MTVCYKTTRKGYIRHRRDGTGRYRMEHDLVWEEHFGPIPDGMQVHHKDYDKTNNDIGNLQLVTAIEHKRLHSGCVQKNGEWYKLCKICGEYKPCTQEYWYFSRGYINGRICKPCYSKRSVEQRRMRVANGWKRKNYPKKREV